MIMTKKRRHFSRSWVHFKMISKKKILSTNRKNSNELSSHNLKTLSSMETKMKKIETEKHVLMTRIGELNSNENKYETKYLEEKSKNGLLLTRLKKADEVIQLEKEEKATIIKVKDAMLHDKDDTISKLKKDIGIMKKDLDMFAQTAQSESEESISLQEQLTASLEIREEMEEIIKNLREELKADSFDGIRAELHDKRKRSSGKLRKKLDFPFSHR